MANSIQKAVTFISWEGAQDYATQAVQLDKITESIGQRSVNTNRLANELMTSLENSTKRARERAEQLAREAAAAGASLLDAGSAGAAAGDEIAKGMGKAAEATKSTSENIEKTLSGLSKIGGKLGSGLGQIGSTVGEFGKYSELRSKGYSGIAAAAGPAGAVIGLGISGATAAFGLLEKVGVGSLKILQKEAEVLVGTLGKVGAAVGGVASVFTGLAVKAAMERDTTMRSLTAIMGGAKAASTELEQLQQVSKLPGVSLDSALSFARNMMAVGVNAEFANRMLRAVANANALAGGNAMGVDMAGVQIMQMFAKGKVGGEDLRSLTNWVPQFRTAISEAFGTADTDQIEKFGLSINEVMEKITAALEKLPAASSGPANAMTNLKMAWDELLVSFGTPLVGEGSISLVNSLAQALTTLQPTFAALGQQIAAWLPQIAQGLQTFLDPKNIQAGLAWLEQLGKGVVAFAKSALLSGASIVDAVGTVIQAVIKGAPMIESVLINISKVTLTVMASIIKAVATVTNAIEKPARWVSDHLPKQDKPSFGGTMKAMGKIAANPAEGIGEAVAGGLARSLKGITDLIPKGAGAELKSASDAISGLIPQINSLGDSINGGVAKMPWDKWGKSAGDAMSSLAAGMRKAAAGSFSLNDVFGKATSGAKEYSSALNGVAKSAESAGQSAQSLQEKVIEAARQMAKLSDPNDSIGQYQRALRAGFNYLANDHAASAQRGAAWSWNYGGGWQRAESQAQANVAQHDALVRSFAQQTARQLFNEGQTESQPSVDLLLRRIDSALNTTSPTGEHLPPSEINRLQWQRGIVTEAAPLISQLLKDFISGRDNATAEYNRQQQALLSAQVKAWDQAKQILTGSPESIGQRNYEMLEKFNEQLRTVQIGGGMAARAVLSDMWDQLQARGYGGAFWQMTTSAYLQKRNLENAEQQRPQINLGQSPEQAREWERRKQDALTSQVIGNLGLGDNAILAQARMGSFAGRQYDRIYQSVHSLMPDFAQALGDAFRQNMAYLKRLVAHEYSDYLLRAGA